MKLLYRVLLVLSLVRLFWLNWRLHRLLVIYNINSVSKTATLHEDRFLHLEGRHHWLKVRILTLTDRFNRVIQRRARLRTALKS